MGLKDAVINNDAYTAPTQAECRTVESTPTPDTRCDETHLVGTRWTEIITPFTLVFAGAGTQIILPASGSVQVFEIDIQPSATVNLQIIEGGNSVGGVFAGGNPVSLLANVQSSQIFNWTGKYVRSQNISVSVSAACTLQGEIRYRTYQ